MTAAAIPIIAGAAAGPLLRLRAPLSFWGGVDPGSGVIIDAQNDGFGQCISDTVLALGALRGSSSSSSVLLELIHAGAAPAALIVNEADAILIAGILAAREMGWSYPPLFKLTGAEQSGLPTGRITIEADGTLSAG